MQIANALSASISVPVPRPFLSSHLRVLMLSLSLATLAFGAAEQVRAEGSTIPKYKVDPYWPKQLPNDWIFGQVGGITSDKEGHVWVLQRPLSLSDDEKAASLKPPVSKCCKPGPPVMEFDSEGNLLRAWGGPGPGYDWPAVPHGIDVDANGIVWITGNGKEDGVVLKFDRDGKFLGQIGKNGPQTGNADTTRLGRPAQTTTDAAARELYVADGYGNRRVIVYDSETLQFKRMWGAYGNKPSDESQPAYSPKDPVAQQFRNPVHCVKIASDGLVYICDRENNRVQIFKKDGTFVQEFFYEKDTLGAGSVWDLVLWPDKKETYFLTADGQNNEIRVTSRETGDVKATFGHHGRNAGQFHQVHDMTIDKDGNIYTGEVDNANRVQKFVPDIKPDRH